MHHELNIGQRRCPKCGWVGSTSIHAKCHCEMGKIFEEILDKKDVVYDKVDGISFYPTYRLMTDQVRLVNYIITIDIGSRAFVYTVPGVRTGFLWDEVISLHEYESTEGGVTYSFLRAISYNELINMVFRIKPGTENLRELEMLIRRCSGLV